MSDPTKLTQIDKRIAKIRENLRDLIEQAAVRSGASDEDRADALIAAQEAELEKLLREREALAK
jgi:hypothetical protein